MPTYLFLCEFYFLLNLFQSSNDSMCLDIFFQNFQSNILETTAKVQKKLQALSRCYLVTSHLVLVSDIITMQHFTTLTNKVLLFRTQTIQPYKISAKISSLWYLPSWLFTMIPPFLIIISFSPSYCFLLAWTFCTTANNCTF